MAACILKLRARFLCCWRICVVCLALELVGPWVVLGFIVGMKAFDVLEKTLESPLDYKEIKSVNPKINQL